MGYGTIQGTSGIRERMGEKNSRVCSQEWNALYAYVVPFYVGWWGRAARHGTTLPDLSSHDNKQD